VSHGAKERGGWWWLRRGGQAVGRVSVLVELNLHGPRLSASAHPRLAAWLLLHQTMSTSTDTRWAMFMLTKDLYRDTKQEQRASSMKIEMRATSQSRHTTLGNKEVVNRHKNETEKKGKEKKGDIAIENEAAKALNTGGYQDPGLSEAARETRRKTENTGGRETRSFDRDKATEKSEIAIKMWD
jgi:hypothetical protein